MLVGSLLALMAFLLAITMGMASDRYDTRRGLVLTEANAIGTTYLRAGYLPEPASTASRVLLREYVPLRLATNDMVELQRNITRTDSILLDLWATTEGRGPRRGRACSCVVRPHVLPIMAAADRD